MTEFKAQASKTSILNNIINILKRGSKTIAENRSYINFVASLQSAKIENKLNTKSGFTYTSKTAPKFENYVLKLENQVGTAARNYSKANTLFKRYPNSYKKLMYFEKAEAKLLSKTSKLKEYTKYLKEYKFLKRAGSAFMGIGVVSDLSDFLEDFNDFSYNPYTKKRDYIRGLKSAAAIDAPSFMFDSAFFGLSLLSASPAFFAGGSGAVKGLAVDNWFDSRKKLTRKLLSERFGYGGFGRFHSGGTVPGRGDVVSILKGGETVRTEEQERALQEALLRRNDNSSENQNQAGNNDKNSLRPRLSKEDDQYVIGLIADAYKRNRYGFRTMLRS